MFLFVGYNSDHHLTACIYLPSITDAAPFFCIYIHRSERGSSDAYKTPGETLKAEVDQGTANSYEALSAPKGVNRYSNLCFDPVYVNQPTAGTAGGLANYETVGEISTQATT